MGWIRLEDKFHDHPKVLHVGREAREFWIAAMCWSSEKAMDGFVPSTALRSIAGRAGVRGAPSALVARLLTFPPGFDLGLFEEASGGFIVHDYLDFNPSAAEQESRRAAKVAAGKLGGKQSGSTRRSKTEADASPNPEARGQRKRSPVPSTQSHEAATTSERPLEETNTEEVVALAAPAAPRSPVRAVPKQSQGVPKPHQEMIGALGQALGDPKTRGDWGRYATAAADLCRAGADPLRVGWLVERWGELFPGATCTPTALSNNYATLTGGQKGTAASKALAANGHRASGTVLERNLANLASITPRSDE